MEEEKFGDVLLFGRWRSNEWVGLNGRKMEEGIYADPSTLVLSNSQVPSGPLSPRITRSAVKKAV